MNTGIGEILQAERRRQELELDEVETATKIRGRYLRAIEDEDWEALPGGAYTRGFIRTYADHLGLDGDRLADEYRRMAEAAEERYPRLDPVAPRRFRRDGRGIGGLGQPPSPALIAGGVVLAVVVILIGIGLLGGDDGGDGGATDPAETVREEETKPQEPPRATLELRATAEVWVCLIDARGRRLLNGEILAPGAEEGPFESGRFVAAFGNGAFEMQINGSRAPTDDSSSPIGYRIGRRGGLTELPEGQRPDCA